MTALPLFRAVRPDTVELLPLDAYDRIVVAFSGGKDSLAVVLHLLDAGVSPERIELWHHHVDGDPHAADGLMDWPITADYCRAVARRLGVRLRFSWKDGGFEREMLRHGAPTAPTTFEDSDGRFRTVGGRGPLGTREQFPQVSGDLRVRWCSAYLKIDVGTKVFANDPAFRTGRFLFCSGERREESASRARYAEREPHRSNRSRRRVDHWRPVIEWTEERVWQIIERHRIRPHPAYYLGWGRVSCRTCIFGGAAQWASVRDVAPDAFERVARYEERWGKTIQRSRTVRQLADAGTSHASADAALRALANGREYPAALVAVGEAERWTLPSGAYHREGGPS